MKPRLLLAVAFCFAWNICTGQNAVVAPYILTPPAPATPRINGADVFGVRPGSPLLYTIPATGERPMEFSIKDLPPGLALYKPSTIYEGMAGLLYLNPTNGQITGKFWNKGEFTVTLVAKNSLGTAEKKFRIVCGDQIALTPPMGWNSWNCFAGAVSEERVKSAADAMVKSGLINHGWTYINVDDFWQNNRDWGDPTLRGPFRDPQGVIVPNARFPDMKGMADHIHSLGLKAGLYSSPGPWTCGGGAGSFQHEQQDAETYAKWGFDYLKYDWCSYGSVISGGVTNFMTIGSNGSPWQQGAAAVYPYQIMGKFLREQNRDIVFSLCQYGMDDVWKWGGPVHGNSWRTSYDITDNWKSMSSIGFNQDRCAPYAKPGNWNDPDMLIVGQVGWGNLHPTGLTPDEQYTHISLWCLLSAPLLIGCDMQKLDAFTLNLLSNDEVLALDQDALGKQATCVLTNGDVRVFEKELEDGGRALGFFNLGSARVNLNFNQLAQIGFSGKLHVRDLWRNADLRFQFSPPNGSSQWPSATLAANGILPLTIPAHGVALYKLTAAK
jgi:alpha-galactosidase